MLERGVLQVWNRCCFAIACLPAELYGDEKAAATLSPEAVEFPGVRYEITGF